MDRANTDPECDVRETTSLGQFPKSLKSPSFPSTLVDGNDYSSIKPARDTSKFPISLAETRGHVNYSASGTTTFGKFSQNHRFRHLDKLFKFHLIFRFYDAWVSFEFLFALSPDIHKYAADYVYGKIRVSANFTRGEVLDE